MIDAKKVLIATPSIDGKHVTAYSGGLAAAAAAGLVGGQTYLDFNSDIRRGRSLMVAGFLFRAPHEHLLFIDADIGFAARDVRLLLGHPPHPDTDEPYEEIQPQASAATLDEHGDPLITVGSYAKKIDPMPRVLALIRGALQEHARGISIEALMDAVRLPEVKFGLGFCRISRAAFEKILATDNPDTGAPLVGSWDDREVNLQIPDLFPSGPAIAGSMYMAEDHGFWHLVQRAGIIPFFEPRVRLVHIGMKEYALNPPRPPQLLVGADPKKPPPKVV